MSAATLSDKTYVSGALRAPGAILLVSCYELGHQPMGLAAPMALLERSGFQPEALDYSVDGFDREKVERARLIAISVPMHTALRLGVRFAGRAREVNRGCAVCFHGLYAVLNRDYLLEQGADAVIGPEDEQSLQELAEALDRGEGAPSTPALGSEPGRASGMLPHRSRLPGLEKYARLEVNGELRVAGYVEATRGCKHGCTHCPIPPVYHRRFRTVPVEMVLEDIRRQVALGARHVTFGDPDFLNGPGHSTCIARALHAEFPHLTFDCTAKIEHLLKQRRLLPELASLGCLFIVSAVESLNPEVLRHLEKGHTAADVVEAARLVRAAGITLRPSLVPFTPWETLDSYVGLLEWAAAEELIESIDPVHYSIRLLVPPGSLLLRHPAMQPHLGPLDEEALSYAWTHPDPRMDRLQQRVASAVEAGEAAGDPFEATFASVRELAYAARAETAPPLPLREPRPKPPRLTESWFC
jgi:radical SAM superfamily enzyme YgiQ (UPF0313 family)